MSVAVDVERARVVVRLASDAFSRREMILGDTSDLVENQIPKGVSPLTSDHANFLFFTVFNDHGVRSTHLYSRAKRLFESEPHLFRASDVINLFRDESDQAISEFITKRIGARYPAQAARSWYLNSVRLIKKFDGDAAILFRSFTNASHLLGAIKSFRGYGPKTGGMLVRAITGLGFARLTGLQQVLVPVDIHDTRIAFSTGILRHHDNRAFESLDYQRYSRLVQEILLEACSGLEDSWLEADRALWLIGSKGCVNLRCDHCPLNQVCSIGKSRVGQIGQ